MSTKKIKSVLLIDDNEIDNFTNSKLIENFSFSEKVTAVSSARAGLDFLNKCSDDALPEIIFLDIMMPVMDGFGFLEEFGKLKESVKSKCRVIMLSTSESFKDLNRANKNPHVYKFLNKPLSDAMLQALSAQ